MKFLNYRIFVFNPLVVSSGLAKYRFMRKAINLVPNSRFESGQSSSGKSLAAIVAKEDKTYVLRLGPMPLAKESLLSLNYFGRWNILNKPSF